MCARGSLKRQKTAPNGAAATQSATFFKMSSGRATERRTRSPRWAREVHEPAVALKVMSQVMASPSVLPSANDPCWCGSGRKYKRCHKPLEGRVVAGAASARRGPCPTRIERPPYAETGVPIRWAEPRVKSPEIIERMRVAGAIAAEVLRLAGEMVAPGHHHRRDRRLRARAVHRARRLPEPAQLQPLPEERVHVGERGHLPRHPRHRACSTTATSSTSTSRPTSAACTATPTPPSWSATSTRKPPARAGHRGVHVAGHRGGQAGPPGQRHRPGHRGPRQARTTTAW